MSCATQLLRALVLAAVAALVVSGCGGSPPSGASGTVSLDADGRIGALQVDLSDRRAVVAIAGHPAAERRGRNTRASPFGSARYDALGYDCNAKVSRRSYALPLVDGGTITHTRLPHLRGGQVAALVLHSATRSSSRRDQGFPRVDRRRGRRTAVRRSRGARRASPGAAPVGRPREAATVRSRPSVDARLRAATAVRRVGPGAGRDVPAVGVVRLDRDRPGVVAVAAVVRRLPGLAAVGAESRAAAASLVGTPGHARVPGERVYVGLGAGTVVLPALATVARAHQAAELDPDQEQVGIVRAGRDPAPCDVHGRGGKLQLGRAMGARAVTPARASSRRGRRCGTAGSVRCP
jgi:hypothetical protein